jgi:hypothetical protein
MLFITPMSVNRTYMYIIMYMQIPSSLDVLFLFIFNVQG